MTKIQNICIYIIILFLILPSIYSKDNKQKTPDNYTDKIGLTEAIKLAKKNHPDIQIINFKIKRVKLDVKAKYGDKRFTELVELQEKLDLKKLSNQQDDLFDTVELKALELYQNAVIAKESIDVAEKDTKYANLSLETNQKAVEKGLIDTITYHKIAESAKLKEQDIATANQEYKNNLTSLKLVINYPLNVDVTLTDDIIKFSQELDLTQMVQELFVRNRYIQLADMNKKAKKLEYDSKKESGYSEDEVKKSEYEYQMAVLELAKVQNEQRSDIINKFLDAQTKSIGIQTAQKILQTKGSIYQVYKYQYDKGYLNKDDLNNAEIDVLKAKIGLKKAIAEYNIAILKYNQMLR